jgi:hypothetical protein
VVDVPTADRCLLTSRPVMIAAPSAFSVREMVRTGSEVAHFIDSMTQPRKRRRWVANRLCTDNDPTRWSIPV